MFGRQQLANLLITIGVLCLLGAGCTATHFVGSAISGSKDKALDDTLRTFPDSLLAEGGIDEERVVQERIVTGSFPGGADPHGLATQPDQERVRQDQIATGSFPGDTDPNGLATQTDHLPKLEDSRFGLDGGSPDLDAFFNFNSWAIRKDAEATIIARGKLLKTSHRNSQLLIEGHCDERGTVKYNLVLGQKRARAIQHYLVDLGIDPSRIRLISYGKEKPACFEQNETCYQLNRRGHFAFVRN